ncbi:MAG: TonB-dependent receptor domain-containing protein, partial [Janthinobacterium lividum]
MRLNRRRNYAGLLVLASAAAVHGQTNTTSLNGAVTDPTGARLPGTTVMLKNNATGAMETVETNKLGEYNFPQSIPGHYTVQLHRDGFGDEQTQIDLLIATPLTLNFHLSVGASQIIEVEAALPTSLNTTDASLGKAFDDTQIQTLPYLANNTLSLLALQPGVIAFDASNTTDTRAGTINGARQDQTNITLDGVDDNDANYGTAFTGVLRATRDSLEEFRVTTSGANADAGRSSGAQVALATKSGTNRVRGSAYYYYRDPAAASNNWFYKQSELSSGHPNIAAKVLQDTFGGSLGFPVLHDKLFFFGAYEGYKQASNTVVTRTVPLGSGNAADFGIAPGLRNGTVSYLNTGKTNTTLTPAQIAAMDTGCAAAGGCPNGPGLNTAALAFMRQFPVSNTTAAGDLLNTGGYTFASPSPVSNVTNIARVDYTLTPKQTMFVRGNLQSDNTLASFEFPGGVPTSNTYGNNRGIAAGHIWTINEHLINNARYGWTRLGNAARGGVSSDYVTFAALSALTPTTSSTILLENTHNFADDFTIIKGRHTIQVGTNDRLIYNHRTLTNTLYRNASVTQSYLAVGSIANTGQNLDATAAGYPAIASSFSTSYDQAVTAATGLITYASEYVNYAVKGTSLTALPAGSIPTRVFKNFEQEYYGQDQWKITPRLTVTAGLRYSYLGVPYETSGQEVVPTTSLHNFLANRIAGMQAGTSYNATISIAPGGKVNNAAGFWNAQKLNFAPRLAFNYAPTNTTSIRAGFMLAYDHFGQGAVNNYNDNYSFGLSSQYAATVGQQVNTSPRFTSPTAVPTSILPTPSAGGSFPVTNVGGLGYITQSFDDHLSTPYSEVLDFSLQHDFYKGLTLTATYVGRLGRHLLLNEDYAMPLNLTDTVSGQTYISAMTALDKYYDAGTATAAVPNIAYWQNMFPNA